MVNTIASIGLASLMALAPLDAIAQTSQPGVAALASATPRTNAGAG